MIIKDNKKIFKIYSGENIIQRMYKGTTKIFEYLPIGYKALSYVETDSTTPYQSFICTDIPLKDISVIKCRYQLLSTTSSYPIIFATYVSGSTTSTNPYITVSGRKAGNWELSPTTAKTSRDIVDYTITSTDTSTNLLKIGEWVDNYWSAISRYYYVQIYDKSNELIRFFVPCKNNSNVVGMYDLVNKVFYESDGTLPFANNETNN